MLTQPNLALTGQVLLGVLVTVAAIYDAGWRRIPNWLVVPGIFAGVLWNLSALGASGLARSSGGLGVGLLLSLPLYLIRGCRAGDVKLLAAVGAITGPYNCFWIFVSTSLFAAAISILLVVAKGRVAKTVFNTSLILHELIHFRAPYRASPELDVRSSASWRLPHGVFVFVGAGAFLVAVNAVKI